MKKTWKSRFAALAAALTLAATALAVPAFAANTPVAGPSVTFDKYLVLDKSANVPNATFEFEVTGGPEADKVAVGSAVFTPQTPTYDAPQAGDTIELNGKKYAAVEVTADFSGVSFTAPGTYRYTVKEKASTVPGVTADSNTYYIDIMVVTDDNSVLSIAQDGISFNNGAKKATGFVNTFGSTGLTLTKKVTGNQGDRNKYFEFNVAITNAPAGSVYNVTLPAADNNAGNSNTITVGRDGTVNAAYYLKHGQSIVINGLTEGVQYTITENTADAQGYTVSHTIDGGAAQNSNATAQQTMDATSDTVVFTNHREGTVPTGILLDVAPYVLLVVAAGAALVVLQLTKKRRTQR